MWLIFALSGAFCFGIRGILYQWSSRRGFDSNTMLLGVYLSGTITSLSLGFILNEQWSKGALIGIVMGLFSFVANGSMYKSFSLGKASLVAVLTSLSSLIATIAAFLLWGEKLTLWQLAALIFMVGGIVLIRYSSELSLNDLNGVHWAILTMFFFGLTDTLSKQSVLWNAATFPTLSYMFITGSILFTIQRLRSMKKTPSVLVHEQPVQAYTPARTIAWGMFVGLSNVTGMFFMLTAMEGGPTGLVSAVSATSVLMILGYARFMLKELLSRRQWTGIAMAVLGLFVIRLLS